MFEEHNEIVSLYRLSEPTDFTDAVWSLVGTVTGRIEPVGAGESFINNQNNQMFSNVMFLSLDQEGIVLPQDGLIDSRGKEYINISEPEVWRNFVPYVMLKLEKKQFRVGV